MAGARRVWRSRLPAVPVNPHAEVALWANGAPGSEGKTAPEVVTQRMRRASTR